ncbi:CHC2 zinc finger domain-containing protein [Chryseobacterium salviniae]|uniref:CHC2 zinc finger domain-containing protein n=1 Tax=Chryseobacterium salviniae TaxID=3101750 RepID=A0ABU6HY06_9FLAO|nr:CHC2 zinc finger domain-containing protein [Chryseobacterium sp. T9W2-O]MEC3877939.1 CHC2 zinc finger domain-containing protein [Chryseobacterium sp. T9W2-O]MEC3877951.1 CHC2 zinc finger domain-containing protein [Chryseobacterium sp. T9W2-O]
MEITEIKSQLSIANVLHYYGLKPDKNNKMCCPFHEDKTPSMQIYYKTQTAYCFSSNCKTHGKSMDVIDFIMHKENLSKHEAIKKAEEILNPGSGNQEISKEKFLTNMFQYFRNAISNSKPAKEYLEKRNLDNSILEIGYNSGQFHHGERKTGELINNALEIGLLLDKGLVNNRTKEKAYQVFANKCIIFPLKNRDNEIVSIYGRSILEPNDNKLAAGTSRHFYLKNRSGIYPGYPKKDTKKLILTEAIIDCASLLQINPIANSYSLMACFGTNGLNEEILQAIKDLPELEEIIFCFDQDKAGKMAVAKCSNLIMEQCNNVKITSVELPNNDVNETLQLHDESIFTELLSNRKDIFLSTEGDSSIPRNDKRTVILTKEESPKAEPKTAAEFLQQKDLLKSLNQLIEKAGIIGEENSRLLLFLITISYLNKSPLHGIVQGSSGSGKTHIISRIADLMPQEDVLRFTRITESSLYNWGEFDLFQKIIIIEDLDGLKEDALYALREFISNQVLRSSVTIKDKKGNNKSSHKIVKGQFSSLSATTKGETYEDNMNRSFIIAINESEEQTEKIINYQNRRNAGEVDKSEEQKAISFIQKIVKNLKHYEVINPFATQIQLPNNVKNKRRLNEMFQSIIKQITIIHQYQRETKDNFLITEIEDIENAVEILFESIILKIDELDGSLRQFFEKLKKAFKEDSFTRFDAMEVTGFKKTQLQFYLNELVRLEYLKQIGYANKGFKYKISYSDNIQKVRKDLKEAFTKQLEELKKKK